MAGEFFRSGWDAHGTDDSQAGGEAVLHGIARSVYIEVSEARSQESGVRMKTVFITAVCLAWTVGPTPAAAQGPIRDLRCENATNPRGVKAPRPQLSWTWGQPRPPRAYQVLVASSEQKLK